MQQKENLFLKKVPLFKTDGMNSRPATDKTLEQGYCLSDLQWLYRETGNTSLEFLTTIQQMTKVTGRTCHLHQVAFLAS